MRAATFVEKACEFNAFVLPALLVVEDDSAATTEILEQLLSRVPHRHDISCSTEDALHERIVPCLYLRDCLPVVDCRRSRLGQHAPLSVGCGLVVVDLTTPYLSQEQPYRPRLLSAQPRQHQHRVPELGLVALAAVWSPDGA
jgi:hypothetical protein